MKQVQFLPVLYIDKGNKAHIPKQQDIPIYFFLLSRKDLPLEPYCKYWSNNKNEEKYLKLFLHSSNSIVSAICTSTHKLTIKNIAEGLSELKSTVDPCIKHNGILFLENIVCRTNINQVLDKLYTIL
jgi:hypothetical protein